MSVELRATYRLQLTADFGFAAARSLVPYLRDLGISHLYLSPSFQARPGSTHGYDVTDPKRVSDDLGGESELRSLSACARDAGLGLILDVVPNHMAADDVNRYWADPQLRAKFFDVEAGTGVYRRFFDIGDLGGLHQEDPDVFEETHSLVVSLVREGVIDGVRIDHPDGLADPAGYLERLRSAGVERAWVEKILDPGERLRDWPVSGTVGYEFLNDVCALFVDPAGEAGLTALWEQVSGDARSFGEVAREAKLEQVHGPFCAGRGAPRSARLERRRRSRWCREPRTLRSPRCRCTEPMLTRRPAASGRRTGGPSARPTWTERSPRCCFSTRRRHRASSPASSRPRRRSWPRASRTPRSIATAG